MNRRPTTLHRLFPLRAIGLLCAACAALIACAQVPRVKPVGPGTYFVAGKISVRAQRTWTSLVSTEKMELWTVDGPGLQSLRFVTGLSDGDALIEEKEGGKLPKFRAGMDESEIMEFVVDSMEATSLTRVRGANLRPAQFGSERGFRFELTYLSGNGLEMDGRVLGAVLDRKLYLIMYYGARRLYFPRYLDDVEKLFASVRVVARGGGGPDRPASLAASGERRKRKLAAGSREREQQEQAHLPHAERGDIDAQHALSLDARTEAERRKWPCRAAHGGHARARRWMVARFQSGAGDGAERDNVRAYLWYSLAASSGGANAAAALRALAGDMSPQEIAEAGRLIEDWTPNPRECGNGRAAADFGDVAGRPNRGDSR